MTFILALHILLVLSFTIRILLRDDLSPPVRLAWFIVLNVLPYVGIAIYFLFGETDLGHRADKRHKEIFDEIRENASLFMGTPADVDRLIDPEYRNSFHYAGSINGFYPIAGNSAALMEDATATRDSMIADIDAAQEYVHVLYYIWLDDHTGTALANALIRQPKEGSSAAQWQMASALTS